MEDFSTDGPVSLLADASLQQHAAFLAAQPGVARGVSAACGGCRGLFAARAYAPGEPLVREAAALWQLEDGSARYRFDPAATPAGALATIAHAFAPWHGTAPTQGLALRALLTEAMAHNSWGCAGARGLFPVICLANSSCAPNCTSEEEGGGGGGGGAEGAAPGYVLRARRALAAGEECTVAYVPRAWPKARRAAELRSGWGFECACARCAAPHDDTQVARCSACARGRVFLPDDQAQWARAQCADCGARCDARALGALGAPGSGGGGGSGEWEGQAAEGMDARALAAHARALLAHPVLAPDDARVLTALSAALGRAHALSEGGSEAAGELFEGLLGEVCRVCARSGFAALADLGIEVEEEEEEEGEGGGEGGGSG